MPAGRPSEFTAEISDAICDALIEGESLRQICKKSGMPDRRTVLRWLDAHPDFAAKYARARESQGDLMDDLILEAAAGANKDNAAAVRVKVDAYKWRAAKLAPKKYGDRQTLEHTGANGGPIRHEIDLSALSDEELNQLEAIRGKLAQPGSDPGGEASQGD